jgi:hypothetical protein
MKTAVLRPKNPRQGEKKISIPFFFKINFRKYSSIIFILYSIISFMALYRFRVTIEDNDDVARDIDIRATHSIHQLQTAILDAMGFDRIHSSLWHKSDDLWRKGKQLGGTEQIKVDSTDHPLAKILLNQLINDPHQKFLFIYDLVNEWVFLVELMKIIPEDPKSSYPFCSKSSGNSVKQYKIILPPAGFSSDEEDAPKRKVAEKKTVPVAKTKQPIIEEEEEDLDDEDAYAEEEEVEETDTDTVSYNEDELAAFEGEEKEPGTEEEEFNEFGGDDEFGGGYEEADERY